MRLWGVLSRDELVAWASPPCQRCDRPVERVEQAWRRDTDGGWLLSAVMVCGAGHRVLVEYVEPAVWDCSVRGHRWDGVPVCIMCGATFGPP
jgi:hypothetical protein